MTQKKHAHTYNKDLGLSMIETIKSSEMPKITQDVLELALDAIIQDGILKDFPVISTLIGTAKMVMSFRDKILVRKLVSFLFELQDIADEEKEKFIHEMNKNENEQRKIGENLIMLIERLDDLDKPILVAKLFKAYLRGDVNYHQFLRFSSVIDQMLMLDLKNFLSAIIDNTGPEHFAEYFYIFGLSRIKFDDSSYIKTGRGFNDIVRQSKSPTFQLEGPLQFHLNDMAFLLAQILLNREVGYKDYLADNRKELYRELRNK